MLAELKKTKRVADSGVRPLFGANINPYATKVEEAFEEAKEADKLGIDIIGIQDHPYNGSFLDTWTLISALAASTRNIRFMTNVADLPLRPPAMLAKAAATLDIITKGRIELGIGAGAFWEGIAAYGGPRRTPGEAVSALEEAIRVIRLIWDLEGKGKKVSFNGKFYRLNGATPGPHPQHRIGIWLGGYGPRMLQLTGRLADGWTVSLPYLPPDQILGKVRIIEEAARANGRESASIRRNYNFGGIIEESGDTAKRNDREDVIVGSVKEWVMTLQSFYKSGIDSFNFWPAGHDKMGQIRLYAEKVIPGFLESVASARA